MVERFVGGGGRELRPDKGFFGRAFPQAKEQELKAKTVTGRFFPNYYAIWQEHKERLAQVDESLPLKVLHTQHYPTPEQMTQILRQKKFREFEETRQSQSAALRSLTESILIPEIGSQELPKDFLSNPTIHYRQMKGRTCYLANYLMVFSAITGRKVSELDILDDAKDNNLLIANLISGEVTPHDGTYVDIDEDALLTTLQTPAFREEFGDIQVGVIKLIGADLKDISDTTEKLKAKALGKGLSFESYFIAMLESEIVNDGWHNSVLLSADEKEVVVHDPSNHFDNYGALIGRANKKIPKEQFIRRWAHTHLRGDYIFALKR